ncbi:MAG TPA: hypothetical protein VGC13_06535 [Longimicrobium sp.]|jgi:hypothetical protein|uniref:hypothetical protein n=1 Tax=Longimicrobium sp. TaxID=2029185 RepID=UPI002EDA0769
MTAALLALAAAAPAHAQQCGTKTGGAVTLTAGQTVRGALAREDFTLPGDRYDGTDACTGRPFDGFFYEAQAGERLTFVLESRTLDPSITATTHWRGGGTKDVVQQRGRRGRTLTATGTVPAAGRILIQVESNVSLGRRGSTGDYTFTLRSDRPARPAQPEADAAGGSALRAGRPVRGELTTASETMADDSYYQDYTYVARRGERLVVALSSGDFDAFLHVGRRNAEGSLENYVFDDDAGGGTDARLEYEADQDGPVTIRVNTVSAGETGAYTVVLESASGGGSPSDDGAQGGPSGSMPVLRVGRPVQGELAEGDSRLDDGSFHDDYTYTARAGERLVVRLESDDFDAIAAVTGIGADGEPENPVVDDDGGGGTNARVEYTASRAGPLLIRANSLNAGETGRYTIVLESSRTSALPVSEDAGRAAAAPAPPSFAASSAGFSALPTAFAADARLRAPAARAFDAPRLPRARRAAISSRAGAWLMAAAGVGMIIGGAKLEDGPAEPLGALIRYTGYATIVFAPLGGS